MNDAPPPQASGESTKASSTPGSTPVRALIVDDIAANCRVLKALLARYGTADTAANAREAVAAFQAAWKNEAPYNLLCLDIMMPEIDGLKLLEVVRKMEAAMNLEDHQQVKVIIISAVDDTKHATRARELGAVGYCVKPISGHELANTLRHAGLIP